MSTKRQNEIKYLIKIKEKLIEKQKNDIKKLSREFQRIEYKRLRQK